MLNKKIQINKKFSKNKQKIRCKQRLMKTNTILYKNIKHQSDGQIFTKIFQYYNKVITELIINYHYYQQYIIYNTYLLVDMKSLIAMQTKLFQLFKYHNSYSPLMIQKYRNNSSSNIKYSFCNNKPIDQNNKEASKQNDNKQQTRKPKIIQISKQQYHSMRKLLQDIQLSMPTLGVTYPQKSQKSHSQNTKKQRYPQNTQNRSQNKINQQNKIKTLAQDYFSTSQHILSFKILKLSQPQQFASIFEQYKQNKDYSSKLLILHRFCSIAGIMNNTKSNTVNKLAYQYMNDLLINMNKLQQNQLVQLLQLYLTLHKQQQQQNRIKQQNDKTNKKQLHFPTKIEQSKLQVPSFNAQNVTQILLPLCTNPSNRNSRILVLLIQMWQLNIQNKQKYILTKQLKQSMIKILKHYQLNKKDNEKQANNQFQQLLNQKYVLKDLAYIGISSYMCGLEQYNAIPLLIKQLNQIQSKNSQVNSYRQIIQASQHILQQIYKLNNSSSVIYTKVNQLKQVLLKIITKLCKMSSSNQINNNTNIDIQQQQKSLNSDIDTGSNTLPTLLHSSLVTLQHNRSNISIQFAYSITSTILTNLQNISQHSLIIQQYGEYWQSAMVMYKLIKLKFRSNVSNNCINQQNLYKLVQKFINSFNIQEYVRDNTGTKQGQYVIQENLQKTERILFDCLVAYRMILTPQTNQVSLQKYKKDGEKLIKLQQQIKYTQKQQLNIVTVCDKKHRKILKQLLIGYRKIIETLYKCGLLTSAQDIYVHNFIISCMIGEAYSNKDKLMLINYLLTPINSQILYQIGSQHSKYGQYVKKMLQKYGNK